MSKLENFSEEWRPPCSWGGGELWGVRAAALWGSQSPVTTSRQHPAKIWPRVIAGLLPAIYSPVISPLWKLKRCNWKLGVDLLPSYHPFTKSFPSSSFWMWCASRDLELVLWQCCLRWKYAIIIIACETGTKSRTANAQNSDGLQFKVWIVRNYILLAGSRVAAGTAAHSDSWRNFTNIELGKGGRIANTHHARGSMKITHQCKVKHF